MGCFMCRNSKTVPARIYIQGVTFCFALTTRLGWEIEASERRASEIRPPYCLGASDPIPTESSPKGKHLESSLTASLLRSLARSPALTHPLLARSNVDERDISWLFEAIE